MLYRELELKKGQVSIATYMTIVSNNRDSMRDLQAPPSAKTNLGITRKEEVILQDDGNCPKTIAINTKAHAYKKMFIRTEQ